MRGDHHGQRSGHRRRNAIQALRAILYDKIPGHRAGAYQYPEHHSQPQRTYCFGKREREGYQLYHYAGFRIKKPPKGGCHISISSSYYLQQDRNDRYHQENMYDPTGVISQESNGPEYDKDHRNDVE